MFQYACARSLALKHDLPLKFRSDSLNLYRSHNGLEIDHVFGLDLPMASDEELGQLIGWSRKPPFIRRVFGNRRLSWLAGNRFLSEPGNNYWASLHLHARLGGYLHGNWQSEAYFAGHAERIRSDFTFFQNIHGTNLKIVEAIDRCNSISVHIRRGDYLTNVKSNAVLGTCSSEYYTTAIGSLMRRYPDARLFAFSDDLDWVARILQPKYPNMVIVEHNTGRNSYIDMRLMSLCRHHIIANSTFSWWGAWLNLNPQKTVIAPARWFTDGRDTQDLIPDGWERM